MNIKKAIRKLIDVNRNELRNIARDRSISQQKTINYSNLFDEVHKKNNPCFILSTGRCGTHLLTKLLSKHKQLDVYHEPVPELIYFSKYAYENHSDKQETVGSIFEAARYEYIRDSYLMQNTFVETNNRITFFAYQISQIYPNSKFIHLVRNPYSFIKSGLQREWYSGKNLHDEGRIVSKSDLWNSYSIYKKIAWLWNETNNFIEKFKHTVSHQRVLTVKSEELFRDINISKEIFKFLGVIPLNTHEIKKIISKPTNTGKGKIYDLSKYYEEINQEIPIAQTLGYDLKTVND